MSFSLPAATAADNRRGIIAMVTAMACFMTNDTLVKIVAEDLPSGEIIAIRNGFAIVLVIGWMAASGLLAQARSILSPLVLSRAVLEAIVAFLFITALPSMPIADITAIFLLTPLLITAVSGPIFKEHVGWRRWSAVVAGFVGMLLVVKPGGEGFVAGSATALALISVLFCTVRDIVTRFIPPRIPTMVVTLSTCSAVGLFAAAMIPFQGWAPATLTHVLYLFAASIVLVIGNFAMIQSFRGVEVSLISPFRYSVMVWGILSSITVFGVWPDGASWMGIGLIVGAGLYTLHRERVRQRIRTPEQEAANAPP
ncbi:DMT family transporter [Phreatobacter aquaticus]|uniref:DMT family transporter n=1 Tax=Phreatobacter aquaticus TaxID=2570229 RepID=A0A4D7QMQ3_9HYPH|nr:DMT family transporter [Phreatobacter aquaticus]QCK86776.1 DMT family transporter [Phreatobacter aquaticus]